MTYVSKFNDKCDRSTCNVKFREKFNPLRHQEKDGQEHLQGVIGLKVATKQTCWLIIPQSYKYLTIKLDTLNITAHNSN